MICTTYFLTFFSELIPPTGFYLYWHNKKQKCYETQNEVIGNFGC